MQNEIQKPSSKLKSARRAFSYIGFALILWTALEGGLLYALGMWLRQTYPDGVSQNVWLLIGYGVLYCIVFPLVLLFLRRLPAAPPEKGRISAKHFFVFLLINVALGYIGAVAGNLSGTLLEDLFGFAMPNAVESMNAYNLLLVAPIAVLVGPLVEELLFRKAILDRTRAYGEKLALVFSALLFAFFHTNLYQFFYAFSCGLVFGYLYLRTGKITVSYLLHALYNLLFGVLPLALTKCEGYNAFFDAPTAEEQLAAIAANPSAFALVAAYSLFELALVIAGFVLLGFYRKKIFFRQSECQLPPDTEGAAGFVNVGVILYIIIATLLTFLVR